MRILFSAGEPSGDQRGAEVLDKLKLLSMEDIHAFGLGGEQLRSAGMEISRHMSGYAVMGFTEIATSLVKFMKLEHDLVELCTAQKPDLAVLVDYPGFNMRLGRKLRKIGIPVVHFVAPQMWAWGSWRVKKLRKSCDILLTLFQFEEDFFRRRGVNSVFTGHPLKKRIKVNTEDGTALGLLPGSRAQEVKHLLPPMVEAFEILRDRGKVKRAVLALSDHLDEEAYACALNIGGIETAKGSCEALDNSRAALVCSGTATLETALHRVPFIVCYKTGKLTHAIAKLLVTGVSRIGMANIVAGCDVAPELIQNSVTGNNLAEAVMPLLDSGAARKKTLASLDKVREALGDGDPAENAAREILRFAGKSV